VSVVTDGLAPKHGKQRRFFLPLAAFFFFFLSGTSSIRAYRHSSMSLDRAKEISVLGLSLGSVSSNPSICDAFVVFAFTGS